MKNVKLTFLLLFACCMLQAQDITQTIRGTILDKDSQIPLIGANVSVETTNPLLGTSTDIDGYFKIENVPVGRHDIVVTYLGYEPMIYSSTMVTAGKELVLNIQLVESTNELSEVVVSAAKQLDKTKPLNELAVVSARTFSVEETSRYAFSAFDPARMAQNYAGVSIGSGDDILNEIVIRGNSPRGVLWRLEGIEIPNPNHFGSMGNSGGGISMLSSSTLSNSDFYTGAFPSEFGNALSGVFDLNMRNGNNEKREYSFMLGALGVEAAAEGYFNKDSRASYLINYRYSTLALLEATGLSPTGDFLPAYQDLSFKINVPTKAGTFALFGLGGSNIGTVVPEPDSTKWDSMYDSWGTTEAQQTGTIGLSHKLLLTDKSYLRTVMIASSERITDEEHYLDVEQNYKKIQDYEDEVNQNTFRASTTYNHKINAKNTFRAGLIFSNLDFRFFHDTRDYETDKLRRVFDNEGSTQFVQTHAQWKHRFNDDWTLNAGLHYSHLMFNNSNSLEPRAAIQWQMSPKQSISGSLGLHSKMEHLATYLFEGEVDEGQFFRPNKDLKLSKSMHAVLAYDHNLGNDLRLKTEVYYQHLFDVPIEADPTSDRSLINSDDIWDVLRVDSISNGGTGKNYGIDLTFEKFFSNQYYFLVTGSLFDSKYKGANGKTYNTIFNTNYQLNLLGGKEFTIGKKKKNIFSVNGKAVFSGGRRRTPTDLAASKEAGYEIRVADSRFSERVGDYMRFDIGLSYKINTARMTHTIMIDVQNVTDIQNIYTTYYNAETNAMESFYQTGLFPNFNYRVEF